MQILSFSKLHRLSQLHEELLAAIPSLAGASFHVEGGAGGVATAIRLQVPDYADVAAITAVVNNHVPRTDAQQAAFIALADRARARTLFTGGGTPADKLLRAVALVLLDEINTIRTTASAAFPLAARTATQFRNAITNKIDAGAAD